MIENDKQPVRLHHQRSKTNTQSNMMSLFPMENLDIPENEEKSKPLPNEYLNFFSPQKEFPSRPHANTSNIPELNLSNGPAFKFSDFPKVTPDHTYSPRKEKGPFNANIGVMEKNPEVDKIIAQYNSVNLLYQSSPIRKKGNNGFERPSFEKQGGFSLGLHQPELESPTNPMRNKRKPHGKVTFFEKMEEKEPSNFHHLKKDDDYYESSPLLRGLDKTSPNSKKRLSSAFETEDLPSTSKNSLPDVSPKLQEERESLDNSKADLMAKMAMAFSTPKYMNIESIGVKTAPGTLDGKKKKTNQDSLIFFPQFMGIPDRYLFAVLDGHGPIGHEVSQYVKNKFPSILEEKMKANSNLKEALFDAIHQVSESLNTSSIDSNFSGTTANFMILDGKTMYSANIGDSRSILITESPNEQLISTDITVDHKPDDEKEKIRIEQNGGRVEAILGLRSFVNFQIVWEDLQAQQEFG